MEAAALADPIRVLIADDHRLFAEALQAILLSDGRFEVVGIAATGTEVVEQAKALEAILSG